MHAHIGVLCIGSLSTVASLHKKPIPTEIYHNGCCAWDIVQEKLSTFKHMVISKSTNNMKKPPSLLESKSLS